MSLLATALASQPQQPRATIGPTDVLGAFSLATNTAEQQYQAKLQQQNALWGGLAGLGGAGLTAYILKGGLFGDKKTPPTPPVADTTATGNAAAANAVGPTQFADTTGATAPVTPVATNAATGDLGASTGMTANTAGSGLGEMTGPLGTSWVPSIIPAAGVESPSIFANAGTPMLSGADMAAALPAAYNPIAMDFASFPAAGTVAADTAAAAPVAAEAASTAPAWGAGLADLLPILFGA